MKDSGKPVLERIMSYCAVAERSTHDVLTKLISWGIPIEECEIILRKLRSEKFLDDTRFTQSYVGEKWNMDRWGKIKIKNGLQQKNIDPATLQKALADINQDEYLQALNELLERKYKEVKSANGMEDARRILMFALSRGYEEELIQEWIEKQDFEG